MFKEEEVFIILSIIVFLFIGGYKIIQYFKKSEESKWLDIKVDDIIKCSNNIVIRYDYTVLDPESSESNFDLIGSGEYRKHICTHLYGKRFRYKKKIKENKWLDIEFKDIKVGDIIKSYNHILIVESTFVQTAYRYKNGVYLKHICRNLYDKHEQYNFLEGTTNLKIYKK